MTQEQLQLLECLRAFIADEPLGCGIPMESQQWKNLYDLAAVHKMTAVVYQALATVPEFCGDNPGLKAFWRQNVMGQAAAQTARTRRLLEITQKLNEEQIPYAVVKGVVCRELYGHPDLRPSGDEDVLIHGEDLQKCQEIFQSFGFSCVQDAAQGDVAHWMDNRTGLHIELHRTLLPSDWEMAKDLNPYFSEKLAEETWIQVEGYAVRTLNPTAHLVFLVAHALKHFITGGVGVRSMGDVLAFIKVYFPAIDCDQVRRHLSQIRGWNFFQQMLAIGKRYLGVDPERFGWEQTVPVDFEPMLLDMLESGIYGQTTLDRKHSASILVQQAKGKNKSSLRTVIFPSASKLSGRYPVLKRKPLLLPVLWIYRIGCYAGEIVRSKGRGSFPTKAVALGKQRQALMERYGIFGDEDKA